MHMAPPTAVKKEEGVLDIDSKSTEKYSLD